MYRNLKFKWLSQSDFEKSDKEVYDIVSDWISGNSRFFGFENLCPEEQAYLRTATVQGVVGNGGFSYLFEMGLGDGEEPDENAYQKVYWSFLKIGANRAAESFKQSLELLPGGFPRDWDETLWDQWQEVLEKNEKKVDELESQFFDCSDEIEQKTAQFFKAHAQTFLHLQNERWGIRNKLHRGYINLISAIKNKHYDLFYRKKVSKQLFEEVRARAMRNVEKCNEESD